MPTDPIAAAHALLAAGRSTEAVTLIARAAADGHAGALYQQAMWHLVGSPLPRDLPRARALLRRAATAGHADARMIEVPLTANGSGGVEDWAGALAQLRAAASTLQEARTQLDLVTAMALDETGMPSIVPEGEPLIADGSIRLFRDFATPAECAHVAHAVGDILAPALVVDPATGRSVPNPIRTSDAAVIGPTREDLAIRAINLRFAAASGTQVAQGEALTVLRYAPGQQFRLHSDAISPTRNQRVLTVLLYLNDGFSGGETSFPAHGLTVRPRIGDAILFRNTLPDGRPDPGMRHAGEPVRAGVKWLATRWIRARPFSPWTGPEAI